MMQEKTIEKNPFFSIIVPVYKTEQYIEQCVESILTQSMVDFEVILVDDGSTDRCPAICDAYARQDCRVKVIHKRNGGLVSARKAGLAECCGRYVVNVDSDDYIMPDHLARFAEVIEAHDPDIILCGATSFYGQEQTQMRILLPAGYYDEHKMDEIRQNLICAENAEQPILYGICLAVVKRELYAGFQMAVPENISRGEDLVVTAPILATSSSAYVLDYCGYFYRSNPTSIMNTFRRNEVQQMKALSSYLRGIMDQRYHEKIDMYVASHYFEFLDRAMLLMTYWEYRQLIRETLDEQLYSYLARAKCKNNLKVQLIFALQRKKLFGCLWILRKIKKRKE